MLNDKIDSLKKGVDGMRMYLSAFKSCPKKDIKKNFHFIQETSLSISYALAKCGLNFIQVWEIMGDIFETIGNISKENKYLKVNKYIQGYLNKKAKNDK
ncbi:MAG: hypothetical protein PVH61_13975 [Candidatus Aminicenantes bacterium]|jgi:hypothetical protein